MKEDRKYSALTGHWLVPPLRGPQRHFFFLSYASWRQSAGQDLDKTGFVLRPRERCGAGAATAAGMAGASPAAHRLVVGAGAPVRRSLVPNECGAAAQQWPPRGAPVPTRSL